MPFTVIEEEPCAVEIVCEEEEMPDIEMIQIIPTGPTEDGFEIVSDFSCILCVLGFVFS